MTAIHRRRSVQVDLPTFKFVGGFTMRKPLADSSRDHMPVPMRPRHGQGVGDEFTAVHSSTFLA